MFRELAPARLKEHVKALDANVVLSVDFDSSEMSQVMTEVLAYGTAVIVEKDTTTPELVRLG